MVGFNSVELDAQRRLILGLLEGVDAATRFVPDKDSVLALVENFMVLLLRHYKNDLVINLYMEAKQMLAANLALPASDLAGHLPRLVAAKMDGAVQAAGGVRGNV